MFSQQGHILNPYVPEGIFPTLFALAWSLASWKDGGFLYGSKSPTTDMLDGRALGANPWDLS